MATFKRKENGEEPSGEGSRKGDLEGEMTMGRWGVCPSGGGKASRVAGSGGGSMEGGEGGGPIHPSIHSLSRCLGLTKKARFGACGLYVTEVGSGQLQK